MSTKLKSKKTTGKRSAVKKSSSKSSVVGRAPVKKSNVKKTSEKTTIKPRRIKVQTDKQAMPRKIKAQAEKQTKTQIVNHLAESTGLTKSEVKSVFGSLKDLVTAHLKTRGSGEITLPDLGIKIRRVRKPATKSRKGHNPFTGDPIIIKAKPARNSVKVSALKVLKEII